MSDPLSASNRPGADVASRTLPWAGLLTLALTGFVVIVTETMPAGLLPQISHGLSISDGEVGQLISVYALGTVLAAIPSILSTAQLGRKRLLTVGVTGFVVANAVTAISGVYALSLLARLIAGAFSGLLWGLIPGYSRRITPDEMAGRGLAVAMSGTPVALSIGTPLGVFLGSALSWRITFAAMSGLALAVLALIWWLVPDAPGQSSSRGWSAPLRVARSTGVRPILIVVLLWMVAHNLLYTYVAPFLRWSRSPLGVEAVLLTFGVSAIVGIVVGGALVDRALRGLTLASLAAFAVAAGLLWGPGYLVVVAVVVWGLTFGGASTLLNTAAADAVAAPGAAGGVDDTDLVAALVSTAWNAAIFAGSAAGSVLLAVGGPGSLPAVMLGCILLGLGLVLAARSAFSPGPRQPLGPRGRTDTTTTRRSR